MAWQRKYLRIDSRQQSQYTRWAQNSLTARVAGENDVKQADKEAVKRQLAECLSALREVRKIVVFGSFLRDAEPHDIDVAVFQDSDEGYLPLALRYRRAARPVAQHLPLDIVPVRTGAHGSLLPAIEAGEIVYER